jgi:hypothetical protein
MMIKYCVRNISIINIIYPTPQCAGKTSDALKAKVVNFVRLKVINMKSWSRSHKHWL